MSLGRTSRKCPGGCLCYRLSATAALLPVLPHAHSLVCAAGSPLLPPARTDMPTCCACCAVPAGGSGSGGGPAGEGSQTLHLPGSPGAATTAGSPGQAAAGCSGEPLLPGCLAPCALHGLTCKTMGSWPFFGGRFRRLYQRPHGAFGSISGLKQNRTLANLFIWRFGPFLLQNAPFRFRA